MSHKTHARMHGCMHDMCAYAIFGWCIYVTFISYVYIFVVVAHTYFGTMCAPASAQHRLSIGIWSKNALFARPPNDICSPSFMIRVRERSLCRTLTHGADKDMCAVTYAAYTHTYSKPKKGEGQLLRESPRPRYFLSYRIWSRSSTRDNARGLRVFWEVFIFVISRCVKTRWVRWWCGFLWACDQYCAYSAGAKTWRKHYIFFNVCCSFLFWIRSEIEIRELIWKEKNVGCGFVYDTIVGNH